MESLAKVIDQKFDEALSMALEEGKNSIFTHKAMGHRFTYEGIGLDCNPGQPNRYVLMRGGVGSSLLVIEGINADFWLFQIPRSPGDMRRMEELPTEAVHGYVLMLDTEKEVIMPIAEHNPEGVISIQALYKELSGLRVAEQVAAPELVS